ncbi:MAG: helix-turn-helix transcriptional regulator [Eubacteriales bacterium]|nr:helix-turn-helix transcriptional regulator [Eubacteriales bacterium]
MIDYSEIGRRIKRYRTTLGISQEKLAELLDVTPGYISCIERATRWVNLERLSEIAALLGVPTAALLADTEETTQTAYEKDLLPLAAKLTEENRSLLLDFAQMLVRRQK